MRTIQYRGHAVRIIHGFIFSPGQVQQVDVEDIALDILTQPGEPFVEIEPAPAQPAQPVRRKAGKEE